MELLNRTQSDNRLKYHTKFVVTVRDVETEKTKAFTVAQDRFAPEQFVLHRVSAPYEELGRVDHKDLEQTDYELLRKCFNVVEEKRI